MTRLSFHLTFVEHQAQGSLNLLKDLRYYNNDNYPQSNHLIENDNEVISEPGASWILVSIHKTFPLN